MWGCVSVGELIGSPLLCNPSMSEGIKNPSLYRLGILLIVG